MESALTADISSVFQAGIQSASSFNQKTSSQGNSKVSGSSAPKADKVNFSPAGQGKADFSSPVWSVNGENAFRMSSYTTQGTLVTLSGGEQSGGHFSMGKFARNDTMFRLNGQNSAELRVTFESSSGKTQSFTLDGTARFIERENGEIVRDDAGSHLKRLDGSDNDAIIVNLDDGATTSGGSGNDIIFNLGRNATLDGGDGNDVIMSMGDGSCLLGGNGDDLLKVVRDVLRKNDISEGLGMDDAKASLIGFEKGQSVIMDGGDGNDTLMSDVTLHDARINGGDGDDRLDFNTLVNSRIDAGTGNDHIAVNVAYGASLKAGDGNDTVTVGTASHSSSIDGGAGNDVISVSSLLDKSAIRGGDGEDAIDVGLTKASLIDGGAGNDTIHIHRAQDSAILGGDGDDNIRIEESWHSIVDGGRGNDVIRIDYAMESLITGGDGEDDLSVAGTTNLVDGGAGGDTFNIQGNALIMDDNLVVSDNTSPGKMRDMLDNMHGILNQLPLAGVERQRYEAALRYAEESLRG